MSEPENMETVGTLSSAAAHDLNNLIATILGNVQLARPGLSADSPVLECLEEIHQAASRALELVRQIVAVSRRRPAERQRMVLAPVVRESARLIRVTLPARLTLDVQCDDDAPPVLAVASRIKQTLLNLATNARQAMRDGTGRLGIRLDTIELDAAMAAAHPALSELFARHPGCTVRLTVSDTGSGMDAATLEQIFEPCFTTRGAGEGAGLGLTVVQGIVQAHEGAVEVASQPGAGTTVTLYLPIADGREDAADPDAGGFGETPAPGPDGSFHILYIDDDEALVFLVQRLLERRGYRVTGHTDPQAALAAIRAEPAGFDLVVTDFNMPDMSGLDVARAVRAIRVDLPVAIASGFIDPALRAQAAGAGALEIIYKASAAEDFCEAFVRLARSIASKA